MQIKLSWVLDVLSISLLEQFQTQSGYSTPLFCQLIALCCQCKSIVSQCKGTQTQMPVVCTIKMNHGIRVSVEPCTTGTNRKHAASHTDAFHLALMLPLLIILVCGLRHTNTLGKMQFLFGQAAKKKTERLVHFAEGSSC